MSERYPVEVVSLNTLPERLSARGYVGRRGEGKWEWMRRLIVQTMGPEAKRKGESIRRLAFPNKSEKATAQSCATSCARDRKRRHIYTKFEEPGFKVETRSEPVNGNRPDGAYYLYVIVTYDPNVGGRK